MLKKVSLLLILSLGSYGNLRALDYTETLFGYNQHSLPASSENVPYDSTSFTSLDHIFGSLSRTLQGQGFSDADLYRIFISDPATFSAGTTDLANGRNNFDTQLFLFNLNGTGIATNDDTPSGIRSVLPAGNPLYSSLSPGFYYLLIAGAGSYPADSTNARIFPNEGEGADPTLVYGPKSNKTNAVFSQYSGASMEGSSYSISLTGASIAIPEPSSIFFFGTGGLISLFGWLRLKTLSKA